MLSKVVSSRQSVSTVHRYMVSVGAHLMYINTALNLLGPASTNFAELFSHVAEEYETLPQLEQEPNFSAVYEFSH